MNRREFLETASATAALAGWSRPTAAQPEADPLGVRRDFPVTNDGIYLNAPYITPSPRTTADAVRPFIEAKAHRPCR